MASSTSTGSPGGRPSGPASTATLTTVPGIGASRLPLATASAGSTNRGTRVSRDVAERAVDVDGVAADRDVVRRAHAVGLEGDRGRGSAATTACAVDGVAVAAAEPLDGAPPRSSVRCGCETTLRQATGMPRWTVRAAPACSASAIAAATGASVVRGRRERPVSKPPPRNVGADVAGQERRVPQDRDQQVAVGDQPVDPGPAQHAGELAGRGLAGRRVGDHLGEHRVVVRRDLAAGLEAGVHPDAVLERGSRSVVRVAALRLVVGGRVLGVQPDLDRVAVRCSGSSAASSARPPSADRDLQLHQVDAVTSLGDRVLDLEAGVHLQEAEPLGRRVVEELDGAGAAVVDRLGAPCARRRAARRATSSVRPGAGASSTTFWWRRWSEQSRSPRQHAPRCRRPAPRRAGRARRTARRRRCRRRTPTRPRPRPSRSRRAGRRASRTIRMPRPPPPADALTSSGQVGLGRVSASRLPRGPGRRRPPSAPWPRSSSPSARSTRGRARPRSGRRRSTARAKSAFSDRKP